MDGIILNYDPKGATGIIKTEDGKMFPFKKADWQERRMPRPNDRVDFEAPAGSATSHVPMRSRARRECGRGSARRSAARGEHAHRALRGG